MKLRRPDSCTVCGCSLPAGSEAWWDPSKRQVTCTSCRMATASKPPPGMKQELERGHAGASLAREYERRKRNREERVHRAHPRIGGLLLTLNREPQSQLAFRQGELGEKAIAESLKTRVTPPTIVLMNRRMPGGHGDIDFLAIAPSGVFVIDAKAVRGKLRIDKPWFGNPKLRIQGWDQTKMLDGLDRQVAAVRDVMAGEPPEAVPIQAALCFTEADLPMLRTASMRGHLLTYRRRLIKRINAPGPLTADAIDGTARRLADALPPA